jgi:hypothetical protein
MKNKLSEIATRTRESVRAVAEHETTKEALDWSKKAGRELKDQSGKLGKELIGSDLGKAAA